MPEDHLTRSVVPHVPRGACGETACPRVSERSAFDGGGAAAAPDSGTLFHRSRTSGRTTTHHLDAGFDPDPRRSAVLEAEAYIDPAVYAREKQRIFYRSWQFVCHGKTVREAGSYFTFRIADEDIFVIRGKDGVLRGFYNVCQHRGHQLLQGAGRKPLITCPYHGWSYDTDGRLRAAPNSQDLLDFAPEDFGLSPIAVEVFCDFVFANLDPGAAPLAAQSGGLAAEIRAFAPDIGGFTFAHRFYGEVEANWKNVVDNYLECYHCRIAHPAFADLVELKRYRSVDHGLYSSHRAPLRRADSAAYRVEGAAGDAGFAAWWLWPNLGIDVFPGGGHIAVRKMLPAGPERTIIHYDFYFPDKNLSPAQRGALRYIDEVFQPEDIALCESAQRGLRSRGYRRGRYVVDRGRTERSEHSLHHFHGLVLEALRGAE